MSPENEWERRDMMGGLVAKGLLILDIRLSVAFVLLL